MVDSVERRRQVRVQDPPPLGVRAPRDVEDGLDRVMAATARPEPIRPGLEPCFPLGFQRVDDPGLEHPVDDHGNAERALLSGAALLGDVHPLDRTACHDPELRCTQPTSSVLTDESSTTFPSTPAVARPALTSVTRRTLNSVLARDRSINFCKLRTRLRSPARDAVRILCRKRRTSSWAARQSIACQSRSSSSGPFTTTTATDSAACCVVMVSNLSFGSGVVVSVSAQAHLTRVSTLSGPGTSPVSGQLSATAGEGADHAVPVSCRLSAAGIRLLGPSAARQGVGGSSLDRVGWLVDLQSSCGPIPVV